MSRPSPLAHKSCIPCKGGVPPLRGATLKILLEKLGYDWEVVDDHHLSKGYSFNNFRDALAFTLRVGKIAEREGHHPDIHLSWGKVVLEIWTHKINGLTESDFILAAKCDETFSG